MKHLINTLNEANKLYYEGHPSISDREFDKLYEQLERLEKETQIIYPNSPTQNVGHMVVANIPKVNIKPIPMLSLKKVHTQEEVDEFKNNKMVVSSIKCDGLSVRLFYENGLLVSANTRGNGVEGGLITEHIKRFLNVPVLIPYKEDYIIDGEAIIKYKDFETLEGLQNPRNAAAGSLNSLDLDVVKERKLSFIAWDVIKGSSSNSFLQNLKEAEEYGFETVYANYDIPNEEVLAKAKELSIPCDGVVWRYDDIAYGKTLGNTSHHFNNAVAWKPANDEYETELLDIGWQVGRSGQITPVAKFSPVEIDGSVVAKCSLFNLTVLKEKLGAPYKGQKVWVAKRNQIIPSLERAEKGGGGVSDLVFPTACPICGNPITIKNDTDSEFLFCFNSDCSGKFINTLENFVGKKGLNIKGLSKKTLEKLIDWGWVNTFSDIFTLSKYQSMWSNTPGFGAKSVSNILEAIESSKSCSLESFICALGIPLIGASASKSLANHFGSWDSFMEAIEDSYDFSSLPDFGYEMNKSLNNYDYFEARKIAGLLHFRTSEVANQEKPLEGLTFVISGSVTLYKNRNELKGYLESLGGKVTGSVSKNTSYLICNDENSTNSKVIAAKENKIPIISEKEIDFIKNF